MILPYSIGTPLCQLTRDCNGRIAEVEVDLTFMLQGGVGTRIVEPTSARVTAPYEIHLTVRIISPTSAIFVTDPDSAAVTLMTASWFVTTPFIAYYTQGELSGCA